MIAIAVDFVAGAGAIGDDVGDVEANWGGSIDSLERTLP